MTRLGHTVLVQHADAFREALTGLPLDRAAGGTTGGLARELLPGGGVLFDQDGADHRGLRRSVGADLSAAGVKKLRPAWQTVLNQSVEALAAGRDVDLTVVASELAGATVCQLLGLDADPVTIAGRARAVAAAAARQHLPGLRRRLAGAALAGATSELIEALRGCRGQGDQETVNGELIGELRDRQRHGEEEEVAAISAMLAVAAVNTTVAGLPRAVAWCADAGIWPADAQQAEVLAAELLRVIAPTALLPRVAAAAGSVAGHRVRAGDRLVLVTRHAARAHLADPDAGRPAPAQVAQLVFGAGGHACPGAALARAQLADALTMLAPARPVVVRARADRRSALPGWRSLVVRAGVVLSSPG